SHHRQQEEADSEPHGFPLWLEVARQDFPTRSCAECLVSRQVDAVRDEMNRPVSEEEIAASGVVAAEGLEPVEQRGGGGVGRVHHDLRAAEAVATVAERPTRVAASWLACVWPTGEVVVLELVAHLANEDRA